MKRISKRIEEYIKFAEKYRKTLGVKGSVRKGEFEIVTDPKLMLRAEKEAAKQMVALGASKKEAIERGRVGVREKNRWGVSVCEPVKLSYREALGTFVRLIPWAELEGGIAGVATLPILSDGKFLIFQTLSQLSPTPWQKEKTIIG